MEATRVRIEKEIRVLIWPWCALSVAGVLFLLPPGFRGFPAPFVNALALWRSASFWIGLPLLATLSIGHEFQHGTASLLLAQPIDRIKVWREKWSVLALAVATAAVFYIWTDVGLEWPLTFGLDWQTRAFAIGWLVTATCTATFWTLVGRSVLNGLVLNLIQGFVMFWIWAWANSIFHAAPLSGIIAATAYALLMLWLGRRKFVRFEVAGGSANADLLVPGSKTSRSEGLLRSRPGQPLLNLIRKEVRLLWLVGALVIATVLGVLCLAALQLVPGYSTEKVAFWVSTFIFSLALPSAILGGSLSMGEERASGTQFWHRTLPVSAMTQWLVKLIVLLSASFLALLLPLMVAKFAVSQSLALPLDFGFRDHPVFSLFLFSSLISFAAFWCACAVKGTIRAALLTIPAIAAVLLALKLGFGFVQSFYVRSLLDSFILRFHPFPFTQETEKLADFGGPAGWLILPPVVLAAIQSYRMFRREPEDRPRPAASLFAEVALAAFLIGIVGLLPSFVLFSANRQLNRALIETSDAVATFNLNVARPDVDKPLHLNLESISQVNPQLSNAARILLRDATIEVSRSFTGRSSYSTVIRFRNGLTCTSDGPFFVRCEMPPEK